MNLDELSIAVRERGVAELSDLAIQVLRRHAWHLCLLGMVAVLPWMLLDAWLLSDPELPTPARIWLGMLLVAAQAPLATAPITLYLGEAMFSYTPSPRHALGRFINELPRLLLMGLFGAILALFPIAWLAQSTQWQLVALLERPPGIGETWSRAWRLGRFYFGENILGLGVLLLGTCILLLIGGGIAAWWEEFLGQPARGSGNFDEILLAIEAATWWPWLLVGVALIYGAVFRFCAYLDLRTRREGWELELRLRQLGRRAQATMGEG